jgi:hypothetical protein
VNRHRTPQRGFIDATGALVALIFVGIVIGLAAAYVVPWLWSLLKPLIHALTA